MEGDAERHRQENARDPFDDLRLRLANVERDQGILLIESREAQEKLTQLRFQLEHETRELRLQTAAIILLLIIPPVLKVIWSWL